MANKTSYELKKTAKLTEYETSNCMLYHLKKKKTPYKTDNYIRK